jgi:hypothetical protein
LKKSGKARFAAGLSLLSILGSSVVLFRICQSRLAGSWSIDSPTVRGVHESDSEATSGGKVLDDTGVVFQKDRFDCGAAAFKMILDRHRIERPIEDWTRALLDRPNGTSMQRMKEVARAHAIEAEGWRISDADLGSIPLPAIALLDRNHYVVIESVDSRMVTYADPAAGRFRVSRESFMSRCRGEMLLFGEIR